MDFKLFWVPSTYVSETFDIASATVIEKGDMVALTAGLVTKGVAASAAVAYAMEASADGDTTIKVCNCEGAIYQGTGDAVFAAAQRGTDIDLVGTTTQLLDVGASATDLFRVSARTDGGVIGSTDDIMVTINKRI